MIILREGGKKMIDRSVKKGLVFAVIILFVGISTLPLGESLSIEKQAIHESFPIETSIKNDSGMSLITIRVAGESGLNNWYTSDIAFNFTNESEDIAVVYYSINDNEWNEYIEPFVVHDDGEHTLNWYAVNYEGNTSNIDGPFFFNIDQTTPTISLTYEVTGGNPITGYEFTFTATATDDMSGMDRVEFLRNNKVQSTVSGPGPTYQWVLEQYKPTPYDYFKVIGYDLAGNDDFDEIEQPNNISTLKLTTFFIDISKENNFQTILNDVLSSEIIELENYKIIEKLPSGYTNEEVFDPAYIIVVYNRKPGGNNWIVSNVSITIFYESDWIADVFYQINDGGWEIYTKPLVISDDGDYVFSWYVYDLEGHNSTTEYLDFKIDQTPPEINIIKQKLAINKVKLIANVYDLISNINRVEFRIYYTPEFTDYDPPYEWICIGFLPQEVKVTVYDKAGNSNSCSINTWGVFSYSQQINQRFSYPLLVQILQRSLNVKFHSFLD